MKTPHTFPFSKSPKVKNRKAFALVLSLALMGFMVLLIVTLATMVQMQMRLSRQAMIDFKAKQAAKFAAYQAMSRVQSALGPDTRVSANAMIFDPTLVSGISSLESDTRDYDWWSTPMDISRDDVNDIDGPIAQNRYWVGVWDARRGYHPELIKLDENRDDYIQNTVEKSLTWLVSGNTVRTPSLSTTTTATYLPTNTLKDGEYVRVVSKGSASAGDGTYNPELDVLAPLVKLEVDTNVITGDKISDGKETRIAWWVSDENQKASLNAVASREMIEHATSIDYRLQSLPFYSGIHGLALPGYGTTAGPKVFDFDFVDSGDDSSIARIRNITHISQLDIFRSGEIADGLQLSKIFFHSASFDTKGLLVNVRDGGMKKDLSLGLTRYADKGSGFGNEPELLDDNDNYSQPRYFPKPYGVAGYDFKTTAYPLQKDNVWQYHIDPNRSGEPDRVLKGKGHIFGPQMYGHEEISDASTMSAINRVSDMFSDDYLWKDPGGPLWDQLRSYYNLRAEDIADKATLNERVQTDDRYGFKPVVKRFQVFYVPTFVNYGGYRYGLRLHIMPLLILYNPYDTKIKGDTYYAIRLRGHFRHPVGAFRFAIGYETGNYFQCLRDIRTEMMPSLAPEVTGALNGISNPIHFKRFMVPFKLGGNSRADWTTNNEEIYSNSRGAPTCWTMSRFTRFYRGFNTGETTQTIPAYPLGYGTNINATRSDIQKSISRDGEIVRNNYDTSSNIANNAQGEFLHWQGIVAPGNIVPSVNQEQQFGYGARVAKIPLYLNNIMYAVTHGKYVQNLVNQTETNNNYRLFIAQRSIDSRYVNRLGSTNQYDAKDDANLIFLAYDSRGIEPGEAKIFSMRGIRNYVGNPNSGSNDNGKNGPNGALEVSESGNTTPYKTLDAMMHGLDDGGVLGGCFYVDIPHPESEHAARFSLNNQDWYYRGDEENQYIMFDLNWFNFAGINDFRGNRMNPSIQDLRIDMTDITDIYPRNEQSEEKRRQFGATFNMTPLGYGIGSYNADYKDKADTGGADTGSDYWDPKHTHSMEYRRLELDIWIWQREGFRFGKYTNNGARDGDWNYTTGIMSPTLAFMKGERHFLFREPSFPDPSITGGAHETTNSIGEPSGRRVMFNFQAVGDAWTSGGSVSLAAMRNTRYSSLSNSPYNDRSETTIDGYLNQRAFPDSDKAIAFRVMNRNDAITESDKLAVVGSKDYDPYFVDQFNADIRLRARFYLNWLPINARRHSANYWQRYDQADLIRRADYAVNNPLQRVSYPGGSMATPRTSSMRNDSLLADTLPQSIFPASAREFTIQHTDYNYANQLYRAIGTNDSAYVPYGFAFGVPYAESERGHDAIFNSRPFVNTNVHATAYQSDGSTRRLNVNAPVDRGLYSKISLLPKYAQASNQAYGTINGLSNIGQTVNTVGDQKVSVGLKEIMGATRAPIYHILRKTEVVSNPANLTSASLSFGVGRYWGLDYQVQSDQPYSGIQRQRSYALGAPDLQNPSFALGNSLCPSRISPERPYQVTWVDGAGRCWDKRPGAGTTSISGQHNGQRDNSFYEDRNVLYDMSWLLNDALWDEYYFSTLPYRNDERENTVDQEIAYPQNPRLQYYVQKEEQLKLSELVSSDNENQFEENSSKMWVNGAFNVNSTSIDAWKAILSTYYGTEITDYQGKTITARDSAPFSRWAAPYAAEAFSEDSSIDVEDEAFTGFRALNDDEIEKLAAAIVEHVKDRGPFYSMSHFVNRVSSVLSAEQRYTENIIGENNVPMPSPTHDRINLENEYDDEITHKIGHTQKGVLQAAIDSTTINKAFHDDPNLIITTDGVKTSVSESWHDIVPSDMLDPKKFWENWRGALGPQATGAPTYLMQQDLLSKLGSFLTVRSDTFKIRAYGEVRNPISGAIEGKAWCEMVIQRTPEYMDQVSQKQEPWRIEGREREIGYQDQSSLKTSEEYNERVSELSKINQELGRRFKIVSFRWLNDKEI